MAKKLGLSAQEFTEECFLRRLVHSEFANTCSLKGGVLIGARDAGLPTRELILPRARLRTAPKKSRQRCKR
jgi:hypothetical protein